MDITTQQAIINRARDILSEAHSIRDNFPKDLPHLWQKLEPTIESIENSAHTIYKLAKVQA